MLIAWCAAPAHAQEWPAARPIKLIVPFATGGSADVFGRIYDANGEPVLQNRTRVGSISEIPPGVSDFAIRISVAAEQPTPLKLEQFKASGFVGKVRPY